LEPTSASVPPCPGPLDAFRPKRRGGRLISAGVSSKALAKATQAPVNPRGNGPFARVATCKPRNSPPEQCHDMTGPRPLCLRRSAAAVSVRARSNSRNSRRRPAHVTGFPAAMKVRPSSRDRACANGDLPSMTMPVGHNLPHHPQGLAAEERSTCRHRLANAHRALGLCIDQPEPRPSLAMGRDSLKPVAKVLGHGPDARLATPLEILPGSVGSGVCVLFRAYWHCLAPRQPKPPSFFPTAIEVSTRPPSCSISANAMDPGWLGDPSSTRLRVNRRRLVRPD